MDISNLNTKELKIMNKGLKEDNARLKKFINKPVDEIHALYEVGLLAITIASTGIYDVRIELEYSMNAKVEKYKKDYGK